jgi:hypothetical protein
MQELREKRKKSGGRKKGTPNKKTLALQEMLDEKGINPIDGLIETLEELNAIECYEPEDKISRAKSKANIYLELMQYLFPKRKAIEFAETTQDLVREIFDISHADEANQDHSSSEDGTTEEN